jgi:SAM-dependent methyltransferase
VPNRQIWEQRYQGHFDGRAPPWMCDGPPEQLVRALDDFDVQTGPACDIGCGVGTVSRYLAARLGTVVALDVSSAAVAEARSGTSRSALLGVVAASPQLPVRDESIGFAFDRGCMHLFPPDDWPIHFAEIVRITTIGGYAQLIESKITPRVMEDLAPSSAEVLSVEVFDFHLRDGRVRPMTSALLRRTS